VNYRAHLFVFLTILVLASTTAVAQPKGGRGVSLDEIFAELDTDHDGKISKAEATGAFAQRFAAWDADGDGFATREEIRAYRLCFGLDDAGRQIANAAPAPRAAASAAILKEPADWRLETMTLPPRFAPSLKVTGTEEIRFAPGMFDNTSRTYFTCALAIVANDAPQLGTAEIKNFLEQYYRGLSASVARRNGASPDVAQMKAVVQTVPPTMNRFTAQVDFFDSFTDGRKILLHVEAVALPLAPKKQTCLILLVSPGAKDKDVWPTLRAIGAKAEASVAVLLATSSK
jgi:hypothetical protein